MKQVVQDIRTGRTKLVEVPAPGLAPGMALVRNQASVVSPGTERALAQFAGKSLLGKARSRPDLVRQVLDKLQREGVLATMEAVQNRLDQPMPLGYSSAGRVEAVGEGVSSVQAGDRVACAGGGYAVHAEFALVPENLVCRIPDGVPSEAAAFATLGAVALHGFRLAQVQVGSAVAVIGLGVVGQLAMQLARAAGCRAFGVDLNGERVGKARAAGFEAAIRQDAEKAAAAASAGRGFDAVLICADADSSDPVELAAAIARDRATVVGVGAVGLDLPRRPFYEKELTFLVSRSYGPGRYDPSYEEAGVDYPLGYVRWTEGRNLEAFLDLAADGKVDPMTLITHRFPIERAEAAYELIGGDQREQALGVLIEYPAADQGAPLAGVVTTARPSPPQEDVRLGVLGAGSFASQVILPKLSKIDDLSLVGISSGRGLTAAEAARRFKFHFAASEQEALLEHESINAIAVFTRHHLHPDQVAAALAAGKHVFCEKPLAIERAGLQKVVEALQASDRILTVGFNRRRAPLMVKLKAHFHPLQSPLTMHYRVNAGELPADHWLLDPEQGGGRLIGEGCHFIDAMTDLCGSLPRAVRAQSRGDRSGAEDFVVNVEFVDGSLGTLTYTASGDRSQGKERLEVFGGGRSAVLDDFRRLETYAQGRRSVDRAWLRQDKGHRNLWRAFVDAVKRGGPPPIPYEQLITVAAATLAADEALRTGERRMVERLAPDT